MRQDVRYPETQHDSQRGAANHVFPSLRVAGAITHIGVQVRSATAIVHVHSIQHLVAAALVGRRPGQRLTTQRR